jgi:hypothetical protein
MARPHRSRHPGVYHLTADGSDTRYLCLNDEDREDFLARLACNVERFELALLSWCCWAIITTPRSGSKTLASRSRCSASNTFGCQAIIVPEV